VQIKGTLKWDVGVNPLMAELMVKPENYYSTSLIFAVSEKAFSLWKFVFTGEKLIEKVLKGFY
jgi:hypothetical protein